MFKQFNKFYWSYKKILGWALVALGALLMILFVPLQIWLALLGILFVIAGIFLSRC
jgi:hypothetical protein